MTHKDLQDLAGRLGFIATLLLGFSMGAGLTSLFTELRPYAGWWGIPALVCSAALSWSVYTLETKRP